ncbi:MAG: glycosyltransferase family 2 protein [Planctomycetes bacterium]|nr:glycosyltransferase family 2 protein [Planctomycetota bacterium]
MKLALSAPLPLWTIPTAQTAAALLRALQQVVPVQALVENQFRTQPGLAPKDHLHPISDLPALRRDGKIDLPIYLVGNDPLHLHQLRYLRMIPGLLLLPDLELGALQAALTVDLDGRRLPFVKGFDTRPQLAAVLANMSRGTAVPTEAMAAQLRTWAPTAQVYVIQQLAGPQPDFAGAAKRLLDIAQALPLGRDLVAEDPALCPPVTAVVIGYNSKDIVGPCLQTLLDQDYPNLEVVVVDNASKDGTADFIRQNFPTIKLIASSENLGFAEGNNLVFRTSKAKYVVLLNQDAYARRNWVTELVRAAEVDDKIASVGSKMLFYRCPTLLNSTAIEINEAGWGWDRQVGEKDEDPSPTPEMVFGGCGGAVLYRKSALDEVGGFDPAFFMYYEDTDLAWRLRLAGYTNLYAPLAVVRHDFHGDTGATPGRLYRRRFMSERNRWATLFKNLDWPTFRAILPKIRKYDKGRLEWLEKAVREGHNPEFHGEIAGIIRKAWRWNLVRIFSLWARRRRTQKLRKVDAATGRRFIVAGINEGGHQGDVENFHDRFSSKPVPAIRMGETDQGCLGSGWHTLENPPGSVQAYRWCKGRCWFYLQPPAGAQRIVIKLASPIRPHWFRLFAESAKLGEETVQADVKEFVFALPAELPRGELLEFTIEAQTIKPKDAGLSPDIRDLGVIVFEVRAQ